AAHGAIESGSAPEKHAAKGGAESGIQNADRGFGKPAMQDANAEDVARAIIHADEKGKNHPESKSGPGDDIGEEAHADVSDSEDDDEARKRNPLAGFRSESEAKKTTDEEKSGEQLNEGIHRGNRELAGAAFPAEPKPAEDWDVVVGLYGREAARAARDRRHDGNALGNARDAHIQEASHEDAEQEEKRGEDDHELRLTQEEKRLNDAGEGACVLGNERGRGDAFTMHSCGERRAWSTAAGLGTRLFLDDLGVLRIHS